MKPSNSSSLLILLLFILTISHEVVQASESSTINNFLQCFSRYSNPSYPILSSALYTRKSTGFVSSLEFYVGNPFRYGNTSSSSSSAVKALDVNYVQATLVCAKASGLNLNTAKELKFDGLLYASDVPLVILDL